MKNQSTKSRSRIVALLLALVFIAAACGNADDTDAGDSSTTAADASDNTTGDETASDNADTDASSDATAADEATATDSGGDLGTIDYLGWEGYDTFFGANEASVTSLGVDFNATYMGAPSDIASAFASGGGEGIDLLAWTSANHQQFRGIEGTLSPISPDEVPNLAGLIDRFGADQWGQFTDDNGDWLAIPFSFAPIGITYNSAAVSPTSYADLLEPEFEGRLGIPDVPGLHVQAAAAALGYEAETLTPEQLDEVIAFMQPLWGQARSISPSFGDIIGLLASGEIDAAYGGYPGLGAFTENPDILTVFPEEGTFSFVEVYSIPAGADNRGAALAFINEMLDPAVNAAINEEFAQATTVEAAIPLMSDANSALYPYDDLDAFLEDTSVMTLPGGANGVGMGDFIEAYGALAAGG